MRAAEDGARGLSLQPPRCARVHGWGDTQLKVHLHRLEELEYLLVHRGGRGQSFVYELLFESKGDGRRSRVLPGLIDVAPVNVRRKEGGVGRGEVRSPSSRGHVGGMSGQYGGYGVFANHKMFTGVGTHYAAAEA